MPAEIPLPRSPPQPGVTFGGNQNLAQSPPRPRREEAWETIETRFAGIENFQPQRAQRTQRKERKFPAETQEAQRSFFGQDLQDYREFLGENGLFSVISHAIAEPPTATSRARGHFANFGKTPRICQTLANPPAARFSSFAKHWQNHAKFAKHWQNGDRWRKGACRGRGLLAKWLHRSAASAAQEIHPTENRSSPAFLHEQPTI